MLKNNIEDTYYQVVKNIEKLEQFFNLLNKFETTEEYSYSGGFLAKRNSDLLKIVKMNIKKLKLDNGYTRANWEEIERQLREGSPKKKDIDNE